MGYARFLKDNNGKSSGYRESDGEVALMPEQQSYEPRPVLKINDLIGELGQSVFDKEV